MEEEVELELVMGVEEEGEAADMEMLNDKREK